METILDVVAGRFEVKDGEVLFAATGKADLNLKGENLRAQFAYDFLGPRYIGRVTIDRTFLDEHGIGTEVAQLARDAVRQRRIESRAVERARPRGRYEPEALVPRRRSVSGRCEHAQPWSAHYGLRSSSVKAV